jgi:hypothetical protein
MKRMVLSAELSERTERPVGEEHSMGEASALPGAEMRQYYGFPD